MSTVSTNTPLVRLLPWQENPYGLVSLWDIMKGFDGSFDFKRFLESLHALQEYESELNAALASDQLVLSMRSAQADYVRKHAKRLSSQMVTLGCEGTAQALRELVKCARGGRAAEELAETLRGLPKQIVRDAKIIQFIHVPAARRKYYEKADGLFGQLVADQFPSTDYDVSECGRCFAFGRYTASVFHAMRVLEPGLRSLAASLGIVLARPEWGQYIDKIQQRIDEIDKLGGNSGVPDWKANQPFYSEAVMEFKYFKNAWRNYVMHGKDSYDDERAEKIIGHTKAFMQHLSTRLSE